jgi:2-keto-4-pentenoate hydratase
MSQADTTDPRIVAGMAAQGRLRETRRGAGERRVGWKAGLGTEAAMAAVSIGAPLTGFLTTASDVDGLTTADGLSIEDWRNAKLEPEVAVRLDRGLSAGADRDTVAAAVAEIAPAIEIVDLGDPSDVEQALAGNLFHRAFALGSFVPVLLPERGLGAVRMTVTRDGLELGADVDPAALLGDLVEVVRALADQIPLSGDELRAGDVIITGSAIAPVTLHGGERFEVALRGIGEVSLQIAPNAGTG